MCAVYKTIGMARKHARVRGGKKEEGKEGADDRTMGTRASKKYSLPISMGECTH